MTAPLFLTLLRLIGSFTVVPLVLLYLPTFSNFFIASVLPIIVMVFLALTDYLDGYVARLFHQETASGAFLDPIADKFFVGISFICLTLLGKLALGWTVFFITREVGITWLRMFAKKNHMQISVSNLGKWKSTLQYLYLIGATITLSIPYFEKLLFPVIAILFGGAVFLSFWSAIHYLHSFWRKWNALHS